MTKFKRLKLSDDWKGYLIKYPKGYTILENLIDWISQTNKIIDNVNDWNEYLDNFVQTFDRKLQVEVINTLSDWQESGFLDVVIDEALQTQMDNLEEETRQKLEDFETTLDETTTQLQDELSQTTSKLEQDMAELENVVDNRMSQAELNIPSRVSQGSSVNNRTNNGALVFIDDDTRTQLYELIFPLAQRRNVPITSAAITGRIGVHPNTITLEQFREMRDSGLVEFVSHSHNHLHLDELSPNQIRQEILDSLQWLRREGVYTDHLVYPFGRINETIRRIAQECGITSGSKSNGLNVRVQDDVPDMMNLPRVNFEEPLDTIKNRIDGCKENSEVCIINIHSQYDTYSVAKHESIIDYAIEQSVPILKLSDAIRNFGNALEVRSVNGNLRFGISATGFLRGLQVAQVFHPNQVPNYTVNSRPETYPLQQVAIIPFNTPRATAAGFPGAGFLINYNMNNYDYTRQEYHLFRSTDVMYRYWNSEGSGSWSSWTTK